MIYFPIWGFRNPNNTSARASELFFKLFTMEAMLKKFQQKYNKVKDNMSQWEDLQTRFVSHFRNASSIIHRFPVLQDSNNFGCLKSYHALPDKLLRKQMDSLQTIIMSMKLTLDEFSNVVGSLDKIVRDSRQLIKGASHQQLHQTIGVKPSLTYCIEGLQTLHDMHQSEYRLKSSLFTAFCHLTFKPNSDDLGALQQLLVDQPNISKEEVDSIYNIIFPEDH